MHFTLPLFWWERGVEAIQSTRLLDDVYVNLLDSTPVPHAHNLPLPLPLENHILLDDHPLPATRKLAHTSHRLPPPPNPPPPLPCNSQTLSELPIHLLEPLQEALERENTSPGSLLPVVARMECMLSWGMPQSMARMPVAAESMGPTVPPLRLSLRIWNTCSLGSCARVPTSASTQRWRMAVLTASVVMWALESADTAGPTLRRGEWFSR